MDKTLITTYKDPDIDGFASIIGLNDILKKQGQETKMAFFGEFSPETKYVARLINVKLPLSNNLNPNDYQEIILVDTSNPESTQVPFDHQKIKTIIDHRIEISNDDFVWAKKQIELVGSCATLITEKYQNSNLKIDKNIATFLYGAIVSNTVNFKNKVTTRRDIKAADFLYKLIEIPKDFIKEMFESKSDLQGEKLKYHLEHDHKEQKIADKKFTMFQIEATDIDQLIQQRSKEIRQIINSIIKDCRYDFYLLNCIDIFKGYTRIIAYDKQTKDLIETTLSIKFKDCVAKTDYIIMRKEIMAKIKDYFEKA